MPLNWDMMGVFFMFYLSVTGSKIFFRLRTRKITMHVYMLNFSWIKRIASFACVLSTRQEIFVSEVLMV